MRANILKFNVVVFSMIGDVARRQRGTCDDFINLEDLSAQSSKMLIERIWVHAFIGV